MGTQQTCREIEDRLAGALGKRPSLEETKKLHALATAHGLAGRNFLAAKLVLAASAAAAITYSEAIFAQVASPNAFLFNAMIRAFTHNVRHSRALKLFKSMLPTSLPDRFTLPFVLRSSSALILPLLGQQLHAQSLKLCLAAAPAVANSLLHMYDGCEPGISSARQVFDEMPHRDAIAWTALVCAYARRGEMAEAVEAFGAMPEKTAVAWTAVVSGQAAAGEHAAALATFRRMLLYGQKPDHVAVLSVLPSCSCLGALETGRWIHAFAGRSGFLKETKLCNALVEMYAACGSIEEARQVFDGMPQRDVVSWTAMINGLARHGRAREASKLFDIMRSSGEASPNGVTLVAVLSACAHAGMTAKGLEIFSSMDAEDLEIEHYGCVVDLLCRAGRIRSAVKVIDEMPMRPDAGIWGALLWACRSHGDGEVAAMAAERLLELEPESAANCAAAANLCAAAGEWESVGRWRKKIQSSPLRKTPGCSSVEVGNSVKEFVAGVNSGREFSHARDVLGMLSIHIMDPNEDDEDAVDVGDHG